MTASIDQNSSRYSFQALYKSFTPKGQAKTQSQGKKSLPVIKPIAFNSILYKAVSPISPSNASTSTLDSNYYKVAKTLKSIRNRVKLNHHLHDLPQTMRSYGGESIRQLRERKKRKELLVTSDSLPLSEFMSESREICLKNLMIKIIQNESSKIEEKEVNIGNALDIEKNNLENDECLFSEYSERKKKLFRETERELLDLEKNNKRKLLKLKDIKLENDAIKHEINKYISIIEKDRQYALFINKTFKGGKPDLFEVEYKKSDEIITNYSPFLKTDFDVGFNGILDDPIHFIKKSEELEALIIRYLLKEEEINNESDKIASDHQRTLRDMSKREEELKIEFENYTNEYETIAKDYSKLNNNINPLMTDSEFSYLIQDLHKDFTFGDFGNNNFYVNIINKIQNRTKTILDLTKECNDKLKAIEIKLNESISRLVKYETDYKAFYQVIFKRKHALKDFKQIEYKKKMESTLNKKRELAEERANRIVIKSRKTQAPFAMNKKLEHLYVDSNDLNEIANNALIHYH